MKNTLTILLFFLIVFIQSCNEGLVLDKHNSKKVTASISIKSSIDEVSIINDSLNNLEMDSLKMLFGKWQLIKLVDGIHNNIDLDKTIKLLVGNSIKEYHLDTTHYRNLECYINKGNIKLTNGVLFEFNDDLTSYKWNISKLNNRQLIVTSELEDSKPITYYYTKLTGYYIH